MHRVSPGIPRAPAGVPNPKPPEKPKLIQEFQELIERGRASGRPPRPEPGAAAAAGDERPAPSLAEAVRERGRGEDDGARRDAPPLESERGAPPALSADPLCDPIGRALAHAAPRRAQPTEPSALPPAVLPEIEQLLGRLVRRAAFGGDGRKGTARLEIGAGALAGATLLVQSDAGELTIDLDLPPGAAAAEWRERLSERLVARGLAVREITVH